MGEKEGGGGGPLAGHRQMSLAKGGSGSTQPNHPHSKCVFQLRINQESQFIFGIWPIK